MTQWHRAVVTSTRDPANRGRVRLRIPSLLGPAESGWVDPALESPPPSEGDRVVVVGDVRDLAYIPETGLGGGGGGATDEVTVDFEPGTYAGALSVVRSGRTCLVTGRGVGAPPTPTPVVIAVLPFGFRPMTSLKVFVGGGSPDDSSMRLISVDTDTGHVTLIDAGTGEDIWFEGVSFVMRVPAPVSSVASAVRLRWGVVGETEDPTIPSVGAPLALVFRTLASVADPEVPSVGTTLGLRIAIAGETDDPTVSSVSATIDLRTGVSGATHAPLLGVPDGALYWDGRPLLWDGRYITWGTSSGVPDDALYWDGRVLYWNDNVVRWTTGEGGS